MKCNVTIAIPGYSTLNFNLSQPVIVYVPKLTAIGTCGTVSVLIPKEAGFSLGGDYWLLAGSGPPAVPGMDWTVEVTAPPGTPFAAGTADICQTLTSDRSWITVAGNAVQEGPTPGLDGSVAYYNDPPANPCTDDDGPGIDVSGLSSATLGDTFQDYVMYFPPGSSQCVPIGYLKWSDADSATEPGGNWAAWNGAAVPVGPGGKAPYVTSNSWPLW